MYNLKQNIPELLDSINNYFSPKIIGEVNDVYIKLAKVKGQDVPWHTHNSEDEMFYILNGSITMEVKDKSSTVLQVGDMYIVKRGLEHRVHSEHECWLLLVENKDTRHTGSKKTGITKSVDEQRY